MKKIIYFFWILTTIFLLFYSYTQVDLNLTLSRVPLIDQIVKSFQFIGYFQRPLSTVIFLFLLLTLYILYFLLLILAKKGDMTRREFWILILLTSSILLFSYPAFSYDLFNYMFDAKTILVYHQNPWQLRPLDFPGDPWLAFMHWTHRASIYPPVWIGLSLPFFLVGFNIFLLQLLSFKFLIIGSFILSIFLLEKLLLGRKIFLLALVFYAFNPLMLIENSVSAHNDITMIFFMLLALWLFSKEAKIMSIAALTISVLIKYVSIAIFPVLLIVKWLNPKPIMVYRLSLVMMLITFLYTITQIEIQPWYFVWLWPLAILSGWKILWMIGVGFSLGLLLRYCPFLLLGNWNEPVPTFKVWLTIIPLVLSAAVSFWFLIRKKEI